MGWGVSLALAFAVFMSNHALAGDFRLLRLGGQYMKWGSPAFGSGARISYSVATKAYSFGNAVNCGEIESIDRLLSGINIPRTAFLAEIKAAFTRWEAVANLKFNYVADPANADILIGAQAQPRGIAYANVWRHDGVKGRTASLRKAVICFNPLQLWETALDGRRETFSIRRVATHEIGHTIGLDHPGRTGQLMGYMYSEDTDRLQSGDAAGAKLLYGPPAP